MAKKKASPETMKRNKLIRKRRIAEARAKGTHTAEEWAALKAEFSRCVRCGTNEYNLEKDHIIPVYQGGSDSIENLQPLCPYCNVKKGPESFDWKAYRRQNGF
jgi:5-methylcytosine-specific restriction endonuclease McrA